MGVKPSQRGEITRKTPFLLFDNIEAHERVIF